MAQILNAEKFLDFITGNKEKAVEGYKVMELAANIDTAREILEKRQMRSDAIVWLEGDRKKLLACSLRLVKKVKWLKAHKGADFLRVEFSWPDGDFDEWDDDSINGLLDYTEELVAEMDIRGKAIATALAKHSDAIRKAVKMA